MPPKRKAVSAADVKSDGPPTRTSKRCVLLPLFCYRARRLCFRRSQCIALHLYILTRVSCYRIRDKQLQAAAKLVSDAGHLETKAMSSAPKQNAARKRGPWGEDYLMTSTKSALAHADLVVCPFYSGS